MKQNRRWLERLKTLLIILLTLSAVWMLSILFLGENNLPGLVPRESPAGTAPSGAEDAGTPMPAAMVITSPAGRYGVQLDRSAASTLYARVGPLLGDALSSAGEPAVLSEQDWQDGLTQEGLYLDYEGEIPLSVLTLWLNPDSTSSLEGTARRLLLCAEGTDGDSVLLRWQDPSTGTFYSCTTALSQSLHLQPLAEDYGVNGAYFAYEDPTLSETVSPYTLVIGDGTAGTYTGSNPLAASSSVSSALSALSFSDQNHTRVSEGEVYVDGGDRLEVGDSGTVTYRSSGPGKYRAGSTLAEAVQASATLAENAISPLSGYGEVCLLSARQEEEGIMEIRFGYRLSGSPVRLPGQDWCAAFTVQDGWITEFTLIFRSYTPGGESEPLLPISRAAAILPEYSSEKMELILRYRDRGDTSLALEWAAR